MREAALTVVTCDTVIFAIDVVIFVVLMLPMVAPPTLATVKLAEDVLRVLTVNAVIFPKDELSLVTFAVPMIAVLDTFTPTLALVNVQVEPVWDCGPSVKLLATAIRAETAVTI